MCYTVCYTFVRERQTCGCSLLSYSIPIKTKTKINYNCYNHRTISNDDDDNFIDNRSHPWHYALKRCFSNNPLCFVPNSFPAQRFPFSRPVRHIINFVVCLPSSNPFIISRRKPFILFL